MKKVLFLLLVIAAGFASHAQQATVIALAAGDTVNNTGTAEKVIKVTGGYQGIAVQAVVTKLSGTGAGTVQLFGSLDGTNYKQIGSDYTVTNVTTQSQIFYVAGPLPVYVRVLETGSGTMSAVLTVKYVLRKHLQNSF